MEKYLKAITDFVFCEDVIQKADIIVQKKVILQLTQKGYRNLCNIPQLYSILHPVPI